MQPHAAPEIVNRTAGTASTLGILGGGQLGRMLALAAIRMGAKVRLLSPKEAGPMQAFSTAITDDWHDPDVLRAFAEGCNAVTVESEWAPGDRLAEVLPEGVGLWPRPETVHRIRHKGRQKTALAEAGLPVPPFRCCPTLDAALDAADELGYPVVLKQYEGSYDGYGNATAEGSEDVRRAWPDLSAEPAPAADDLRRQANKAGGLMVEAFADFERELSVIVARRPDGEHVTYPVVYTEQRNHRCHAVVAPADLPAGVADEARRVGRAAVEAVDGVGVTAAEFFQMPDGRILVNELAPRPHNTGHYTIEGCYTSQFENHVRAVLDWPLGDPSLREPCAVMVNVLGRREGTAHPEGLDEALAVPGAAVHIYGKPDVRSGRKMGHVTVTGTDRDEVRRRAEEAAGSIRL